MSESTARAARRALRRVAGTLVTGQVNTHSADISRLQGHYSTLVRQCADDSERLWAQLEQHDGAIAEQDARFESFRSAGFWARLRWFLGC